MFHVYNRRANGKKMFFDDEDRDTFIACISRYLTKAPSFDSRGRPYPNFRDQVRVVTFCLNATHYHLILFQIKPGGIERLMQAALDGYVQKFNRKHSVRGQMCDGEYRARPLIGRRAELDAIVYVHNNHPPDCSCPFCGNRWFQFEQGDSPTWIEAAAALDLFGGVDSYLRYREARADLRELSG